VCGTAAVFDFPADILKQILEERPRLRVFSAFLILLLFGRRRGCRLRLRPALRLRLLFLRLRLLLLTHWGRLPLCLRLGLSLFAHLPRLWDRL
jgi:hypothetical protein